MKRRNGSNISTSAVKECQTTWLLYALVGFVAVACYVNGLNGDFVHDDIPAVTTNKDVLALNPIRDTFMNDFWGTPMADPASHKSYRPLTTLTFRLNHICFGLKPFWFHATNVLLHMVACALFTRICLSVARLKTPFATLGGLLFAAHPIHTEAVTGIVGRADVLASVFFFIAFLSYEGRFNKYRKTTNLWLSILLGAMSILAKETGISVFAVNICFDLYKSWPNIRRALTELRWTVEAKCFVKRAAIMTISFGLLVVMRLALLQGSFPKFSEQDNPAAFHPSFYVRVLTFCYLSAFNWWLLLYPVTLSHDWQLGSIPLVTSISDSRNMMTLFFFAAAFLLAVKSLNDFQKQRHVPLVLGFLLLVLPFMPATNLLVTVGFVVAERVLYIPSSGSILLTVYGLQMLWNSYSKYRQVIECLIILLLLTSCHRVFIRNEDWRSRESLLRAGLETLPQNAKMHYNYGNFLRDSKKHELAKAHYRTALTLWPTYSSVHNNLGTLIEDYEKAEKHFLLAIRYSPSHVNAHYNIGKLYRKANRIQDAEQMLKKCITLDPMFTGAYIELAKLKNPNDQCVGDLLKKVVQINPTSATYIIVYANWLLNKGNKITAFIYYLDALRLMPADKVAMTSVAKLLRTFGDHGRLFQLITRFHIINRQFKKKYLPRPHLYLSEWSLKNELTRKAKVYDKYPYTNNGQDIHSKGTGSTLSCNKTMYYTSRQCRLIRRVQKLRSANVFWLHHILDGF